MRIAAGSTGQTISQTPQPTQASFTTGVRRWSFGSSDMGASAIAFSIPHEALGEEVGAAVTLRAGQTATPAALRCAAARRLASFKVPRRVVVVDAIPLGPTGKPQRIGMAKRLGLA